MLYKLRVLLKAVQQPAARAGPAARLPSGPQPTTAQQPSPDFPQFFLAHAHAQIYNWFGRAKLTTVSLIAVTILIII